MKKLILFLMLIVLCGCSFNKDNNKVKEVNQESNSYECDVEITKDNENIINNFKKIDGYVCQNLNSYLTYYQNNKNAPLKDIIYLVNNNIFNSYSKDLIGIVSDTYFIKNNLDLYLNNMKSSYKETVSYVNVTLNNDYYSNMVATDTSKDTLILVNKFHYLDASYEPSDLETIDANFNKGVNNKLRHKARIAFEEMCSQAKLDNIILFSQSAYRSYKTQANIYNRSVAKNGALESDKTSARPGNSEHETGLALDVNLISNNFANTDAYKWLEKNAANYGFILRYPKDKVKLTGYLYEPWHYRYVGKEVAKKIKALNITFDEYYAYYVEK